MFKKLADFLFIKHSKNRDIDYEHIEKDTICDKCESLNECIKDGRTMNITGLEDTKEHYLCVLCVCHKKYQ